MTVQKILLWQLHLEDVTDILESFLLLAVFIASFIVVFLVVFLASVLINLSRLDFTHQVEKHLVDVLPSLGRRLDVGHLPLVCLSLGFVSPNLTFLVQVALVPNQDKRYRLVRLDPNYVLAKLLAFLKDRKNCRE